MDLPERSSVDASLGISRRTLLLRGGVVAGSLVWSVPVIHTVVTPSAAAGTPLQGISFVAVVLSDGGVHYRMRWTRRNASLSLDTGSRFVIAEGHQLTGYSDLQDGALRGADAAFIGESLQVNAPGGVILLDYVAGQGPCTVGPGAAGMPAIGSPGPWTFTPLATTAGCVKSAHG